MNQTRKTLIAEDEPSLCRYLVTLLDQRDCEIAVEHNGEDAIRVAASFQPDVALIGFVKPGIDGSTTGIGLLKVSPHTNVVFITEFLIGEPKETPKPAEHQRYLVEAGNLRDICRLHIF
jgi:CheY-like chemotaxis protein